jgi:energy-coupling factor transporter transmembrane protein EcfT
MVLLYGATVAHVTTLDVAVAAFKAAVSTTGVLVAVASTSGPQLLGPLVSRLPPWASVAALVTYRAVFGLADRVASSQRATRVRGGLPPWTLLDGSGYRRVRTFGAIAGAVLIGAIDLGGRHGDAVRLRGLPQMARRNDDVDPAAVWVATRVLVSIAVVEVAVAAVGRLAVL